MGRLRPRLRPSLTSTMATLESPLTHTLLTLATLAFTVLTAQSTDTTMFMATTMASVRPVPRLRLTQRLTTLPTATMLLSPVTPATLALTPPVTLSTTLTTQSTDTTTTHTTATPTESKYT